MKIQIAGLGTVGNAQAFLGSRLGHQVFAFDTRPRFQSPYATPLERPERDVDLTFVCVPESAVEGALKELRRGQVKGLYVVKSTVPVGTTERLSQSLGIHLCHNPEFLREAHALEDVVAPTLTLIGQCCPHHGEFLAGFYKGYPVVVTSPRVSETVKLTVNAYLSTLISFWNQVHEYASALGISTAEVAEIARRDRRVSPYGTAFFGRPFQGKCLPKDLNQLIACCRDAGVNPFLLEAVRERNRMLDALPIQ